MSHEAGTRSPISAIWFQNAEVSAPKFRPIRGGVYGVQAVVAQSQLPGSSCPLRQDPQPGGGNWIVISLFRAVAIWARGKCPMLSGRNGVRYGKRESRNGAEVTGGNNE